MVKAHAANSIINRNLRPLINAIAESFLQKRDARNKEEEMGELERRVIEHITMKDDGVINVLVEAANNNANNEQVELVVTTGLIIFLKNKGYEPDPDKPGAFHEKNNSENKLTQEKFEELSKEFPKFLEQYTGFKLVHKVDIEDGPSDSSHTFKP